MFKLLENKSITGEFYDDMFREVVPFFSDNFIFQMLLFKSPFFCEIVKTKNLTEFSFKISKLFLKKFRPVVNFFTII